MVTAVLLCSGSGVTATWRTYGLTIDGLRTKGKLTVLYTYFAAQGDRQAATAAARVDAELAGLVVRRADPMDELARLEAVLAGRSFDEIRPDLRHGTVVAEPGEGDCVVLSLTDPLTRALASAEPDALRRAVSDVAGAGVPSAPSPIGRR